MSGLSTWTLIRTLDRVSSDMEMCHTNRITYGVWPEWNPYYRRRKRQHDRILAELERRTPILDADASLGRRVRAMPGDSLLANEGIGWVRYEAADPEYLYDDFYSIYAIRASGGDEWHDTPEGALSINEEVTP